METLGGFKQWSSIGHFDLYEEWVAGQEWQQELK